MNEICVSLFQKEQQDRASLIYFAECLRIITENTAKHVGGTYVNTKLNEILDPSPAETRSSDEIIEGIRKKMNEGRA